MSREPYKCFACPCMQLSRLYGEPKNALLWFHVPVSQTLGAGKWNSAFFGLSDVEEMGQMMGL